MGTKKTLASAQRTRLSSRANPLPQSASCKEASWRDTVPNCFLGIEQAGRASCQNHSICWNKIPPFCNSETITNHRELIDALFRHYRAKHFVFVDDSFTELPEDTLCGRSEFFIVCKDTCECFLFSCTASLDGHAYALTDFSHLMQEKEKLHLRSMSDNLTGLLSSMAFYKRCEEILAEGRFGLIAYIDLDDLKKMNDYWGHATGDRYLVAMAQKLTRFFQGTSASEDLPAEDFAIARLSGDEFAVCIGGFPSAFQRDSCIIGINDEEPFDISPETKSTLRFSTGVARCPEDGTDCRQLVQFADFSMERVKQFNKGGLRFFDETDRETYLSIHSQFDIMKDIAENKRIEFIYIPYVNVVTGRIVTLEMFPIGAGAVTMDIDSMKLVAKFHNMLYELDKVIFEKLVLEIKKLAGLHFDSVVTLGYMPQQLLNNKELKQFLDDTHYAPSRLCLCFNSEMRSQYDRMRGIDSARELNMKFGFKNYSSFTSDDAIDFSPNIVKLSKDATGRCCRDAECSERVQKLLDLAKAKGFTVAVGYLNDAESVERFRQMNVDNLSGNAIYPAITADEIEEYNAKPNFWL